MVRGPRRGSLLRAQRQAPRWGGSFRARSKGGLVGRRHPRISEEWFCFHLVGDADGPYASAMTPKQKHKAMRGGLGAMPHYPSTKGQKFPAETLSVDECRALLKACSRRAPTGLREGSPRWLPGGRGNGSWELGPATAATPKHGALGLFTIPERCRGGQPQSSLEVRPGRLPGRLLKEYLK